MIRGEKVRLFPTPEQERMFRQCLGFARFSYNECKRYDDEYVKTHNTRLSAFDLAKILVKLKYTEGYEWMQSLPSDIAKQAASDFGTAKKNSKRLYNNAGHTSFKRKHDHKQSFYCEYRKTKIKSKKRVYISKVGDVKMSRNLPKHTKLMNPRVVYQYGKWFLSVSFEVEPEEKPTLTEETIGIDMGLKDLMVLSDNTVYENINKTSKIRKLDKEKRRLESSLSRKRVKDSKFQSKNYYKTRTKYYKVIEKLNNIRTNHRHQVTRSVIKKNPKRIVLEDLDIMSMFKDATKAKAISEAAWYTLKVYLTYKAQEAGIEVIIADKYFPSSQLCNCCGYKNNQVKDLNIRTWICPKCNSEHNRDVNAALNLKDYPDKYCTNL